MTSAICSRVETVAVTDAPFYAYVTRPGSITTLKKQGPKHVRDMDAAIEAVRRVAEGNFDGEFECFRAYCILRVACGLISIALPTGRRGQAYLRLARDLAMLRLKEHPSFAHLETEVRAFLRFPRRCITLSMPFMPRFLAKQSDNPYEQRFLM